MLDSFPGFDVDRLTVAERLELIGLIWDSIPDSPESLVMPEWHRQELERRLNMYDSGKSTPGPWEEVRARLRSNS